MSFFKSNNSTIHATNLVGCLTFTKGTRSEEELALDMFSDMIDTSKGEDIVFDFTY